MKKTYTIVAEFKAASEAGDEVALAAIVEEAKEKSQRLEAKALMAASHGWMEGSKMCLAEMAVLAKVK